MTFISSRSTSRSSIFDDVEKNEEEESGRIDKPNTDKAVYICMVFLMFLCVVVVYTKVIF